MFQCDTNPAGVSRIEIFNENGPYRLSMILIILVSAVPGKITSKGLEAAAECAG